MITPDYLEEIVKATENRVSVLHDYLIGRIAKHIASFFGTFKEPSLMPSNIKQLHQLMSAGMVYEDIQNEIIKQYPQIEKEVRQAFLNSANEISKANTQFEKDIIKAEGANVKVPDYDVNGIPTKAADLNLTDHEVRLLETDYKRTNGTIKNLTKTTANSAQTAYIEACDNAYMKVQHGVSLDTAIAEAIQEVADKGIGVVVYGGGRRENIEVAIARAVRTGINQANSDLVLQRCAELGVGYVKVSEHLGARVTKVNDYTNHSWWQGKVYSINWNDPVMSKYKAEADGHIAEVAEIIGEVPKDKYPDFVTATGYGDILGLAGVNCRHTFSAFYPNIQPDPEPRIDKAENERRYKETQQARAMERAIRKTKRRIAGYEGAEIDNPDVQKALEAQTSLLDKQLNAYKQYCKDHNLNAEGRRIKIAKPVKPNLNEVELANKKYIKREKKKKKKHTATDSAAANAIRRIDDIKSIDEVENGDIYKVCDIDTQKYGLVNANINSNELVLTGERLKHVNDALNHYKAFEQYGSLLKEIFTKPTAILKDKQGDPLVAVILKEFPEEDLHFRVVVWLKTTETQDINYKNSIITFFYINKGTYKKYLRNQEDLIVYKDTQP